MTVQPCSGSFAIVVAHPGHELMVYHWIENHQPIYCCLTDGSGGAAASRLSSTTRLLNDVGVSAGPIYGRYTDKGIYRLLLDRRVDVFVALARELANAFERGGVECVAGDAVEGFNPAHDICRLIIDGAVEIVRRTTGRDVRNYEFLLDGSPESPRPESLIVQLDDAALERKLAAAHEYEEMRAEVEAAIGRHGRQAFATECLRPAATMLHVSRFDQELPFYERFGEKRVTEGRYSDVVRYRDHVRPVALAIEAAANHREPEIANEESTTSVASALRNDGSASSHLTNS
jgi:hypothetical protein